MQDQKQKPKSKSLMTLKGEVKTPPLSREARIETGYLLRKLQQGETLSLPESRPMPTIGPRCHELRIQDESVTWRLIYRIDSDAIVIVDLFKKKTPETPDHVIRTCKRRLQDYDSSFE